MSALSGPVFIVTNSLHISVFEYTYILLWNTVFTVAPVVGIGLFDRFAGNFLHPPEETMTLILPFLSFLLLESYVLMDYPQLYRYGRENTWFGLKSFALYMFDGIAQVRLDLLSLFG